MHLPGVEWVDYVYCDRSSIGAVSESRVVHAIIRRCFEDRKKQVVARKQTPLARPDLDAGVWLTRNPSAAEPLNVIVPGLYALPVVRLLTLCFTTAPPLPDSHHGRSTFAFGTAGCSSVGCPG